MRKIYYGTCICGFVYYVLDRVPNFCPECGLHMFKTVEEVEKLRTQFHTINENDINTND